MNNSSDPENQGVNNQSYDDSEVDIANNIAPNSIEGIKILLFLLLFNF